MITAHTHTSTSVGKLITPNWQTASGLEHQGVLNAVLLKLIILGRIAAAGLCSSQWPHLLLMISKRAQSHIQTEAPQRCETPTKGAFRLFWFDHEIFSMICRFR